MYVGFSSRHFLRNSSGCKSDQSLIRRRYFFLLKFSFDSYSRKLPWFLTVHRRPILFWPFVKTLTNLEFKKGAIITLGRMHDHFWGLVLAPCQQWGPSDHNLTIVPSLTRYKLSFSFTYLYCSQKHLPLMVIRSYPRKINQFRSWVTRFTLWLDYFSIQKAFPSQF